VRCVVPITFIDVIPTTCEDIRLSLESALAAALTSKVNYELSSCGRIFAAYKVVNIVAMKGGFVRLLRVGEVRELHVTLAEI